ncbi:sensor histidine kinase [Aurantiacibacter poecillastricola]|uniref:sensor histidine kinase n=1 Tax=Aurantiacibacter poecillastricola TaxID=3064385 RepID=UPI00273DC911|nr:PAS domain-containing protein [Aurantiacibacter sp. 219JJ12-13]MDP5262608.1 PAS domain-containing protein [Aurantiacibacter sp. 219JJ12-13]
MNETNGLGVSHPGIDPESPPNIPDGISRETMEDLPFSLVIADAQLEDMPLIYVNTAFERVTGYDRSAVLGRNCRFLQGPRTDEKDANAIREALEAGEEITVDILNYRATGEEFINRLLISPMKQNGEITHFLGIQSEQPKDRAFAARAAKLDEQLREVQHRVKNHLALLLSLIRMESRKATDTKTSLNVLANRVEALNMLYDEFSRSGSGDTGTVALGAYISRVCSALNMLDGHREVRMNLETDDQRASLDAASQMGLLVSELLTNALQHAFEVDREGFVNVKLWHEGESVVLQVIDNGKGIPADVDWPNDGSLGARIVRELVARLDGELKVDTGENGTTVTIEFPVEALTDERE